MKGLLIKEMYLLKKDCVGYTLAIAAFIILALMGNDSAIVAIWPGAMTALIPVALLSNDERSKWNLYCGTLPYTKAQLVSAKYLSGLFMQIITLLLSGMTQAFIMTQNTSLQLDWWLMQMTVAVIIPLVLSSVSYPLIFRFGAEKGQIIFALIIGLICALLIPLIMAAPWLIAQQSPSIASRAVCCLIAVAMYALSWCLSIALCRKREIA